MGELTREDILADLKAELVKRAVGYRVSFNYRRVVEKDDSEILRGVDLAVLVLEDAACALVFYTTTHTKVLSDPSPEQRIKSPWTVGTLEDAAKAVCGALEV